MQFDRLYDNARNREHYRLEQLGIALDLPIHRDYSMLEIAQFVDAMLQIERGFHDGLRRGYPKKQRDAACSICGQLDCLAREYPACTPADLAALSAALGKK